MEETPHLGAAAAVFTGVAVMSVMSLTTILGAIVMIVSWDTHPALVLLFLVIYLPYELLYLSATLTKVASGGWVALMVAGIVSVINLVWWWGSKTKSESTAKEKVSRGGSIYGGLQTTARIRGCFLDRHSAYLDPVHVYNV